MNLVTLEKLKRNPHYTLSKEQEEEYQRLTAKKPMVEFDAVPKHDNGLDKHATKVAVKPK